MKRLLCRGKVLLMLGLVSSASVIEAGGARQQARFGDVTLQGPIGDRLEAMIRNHVVARDAVSLTECFRSRSETRLWQGEFWGKYMHGACPFWQLTGNRELKAKIDASVAAVIETQDAEGYIGDYSLERRFAGGTWDVWCDKYVLMGLLHYYDATKEEAALSAALKLCRYVAGKIGPEGPTPISQTGYFAGLPSCSILEPVVWLYNRTGEKDILAFADFIVGEMTEAESGPRLLDLALKGVPVADRSRLPRGANSLWSGSRTNRGKAYEMMSCYQGLVEYALATGRRDLLDAAIASAENILTEEINLAGGAASLEHWYHGAKHQHEAYPHMQETCVTITWMRLCEKLLEVTGDVKYADAFERTFYNAYLAALNRAGDEFASYTPLSGSRSSGGLQCRMHTNCCNENGPRGFVSLLRSMVQTRDNEVFINSYTSSRAKVVVPSTGALAEFEMHTLYPKEGRVDVYVRSQCPSSFALTFRIPGWTDDVRMSVNGVAVAQEWLSAGSWVSESREWRDGDHVRLEFGLPVRMHRLGDSVAFTRGPILLARDTRFDDGDLSEVLRETVLKNDVVQSFRPVRSPDPSFWMTFVAELPLGVHSENPDGSRPADVRFCDYASAANVWTPRNVCRSWFAVERNPMDLLLKEE